MKPPGRLLHVRSPLRVACALLLSCTLLGCADDGPPRPTPEQVRAKVRALLPATLKDRDDWATDVQSAFAALDLDPTDSNLCAALAVTEQESTYHADPVVPGLGAIARKAIEERAARYKVPAFAVRAALELESPNGERWGARIDAARTERELSELFEEMIASVPLGGRLLARANPVRTGGPMQVSVAFAEAHADAHTYPYAVDGSIRHEVFTRRGGLYFGIAHLLDYPASYERPLYRFADFNAGRYASRNAAFQNAVAIATGTKLDLDGDLVRHRASEDGERTGETEAAVLTLADKLTMTPAQIRGSLGRADREDFERDPLYTRVFELAEKRKGAPLPRAMVPRIRLESPKITRRLTTEWFAKRVDRRHRNCMARAKRL